MTGSFRKKRALSAEERALWRKVAESVNRQSPPEPNEPALRQVPVIRPMPAPMRIQPFRVGQKADLKNGIAGAAVNRGTLPGARSEMDRRSFEKLRKGKLKIEARIDLHGMTVAQAGPTLSRFVMDSAARERRVLLVITGKGRPRDAFDMLPHQRGILRRQVPIWLTTPPLSHHILQVTEAHAKHGGGGAYYVYLRRRR